MLRVLVETIKTLLRFILVNPPPFFPRLPVAAQSGGRPTPTLRQVAPGLAGRPRYGGGRALRAELAAGRRGRGHDPLQDNLPVNRVERASCEQIPSSLQRYQSPGLPVEAGL